MNESPLTSTQHFSLFQTNFSPDEFTNRRKKIFDEIGNDALAVVQGADPPLGSFDLFRQSNEFFYLCGVEVPYAYLLLDGKTQKTTLYLPGHNPGAERSEGPLLNSDDTERVKELTGVDEVKKPDAILKDLAGAQTIYTPQRDANQGGNSDPFRRPNRLAYFIEQLKISSPKADIQDLTPAISSLRVVKSPAEVDLMRISGRLTALAVAEAMQSTKPGMMEYHLGAIGEYIYRVNGARGAAYRPIIGGGANASYGHYYRNDCELKDGDMVLMDCAPDYGGYTSDIGRMWPVNGKYAPWQRELYGFIVEYHKVLLELLRPGVMASQIADEASAEMRKVFEKTKFSKPCYEEAARRTLEFGGHLSHSVGLHVHDGGNYGLKPLIPGTVFAIDPQMWVPEEQLYIRAEDTIVITQDGIENLTELAPLELDDVEKFMKADGLFQKLPPVEK